MNSAIKISKHKNLSGLYAIIREIERIFGLDEIRYLKMPTKEYRELQYQLQSRVNDLGGASIISKSIKEEIQSYLGTDQFLVQSNIYCRSARPLQPSGEESVGWHRETFYGSNMQKAVNVWTPLRGCDENNSLKYIPNSHLIPDEEIIVEQYEDKITKRFSIGHKLGFLYAPKRIVSGVDLEKSDTMFCPFGSSAIFSGNLIHGSAENLSSNIRFSCDFRIIPKANYSSQNKPNHISSGQPYFVEIS